MKTIVSDDIQYATQLLNAGNCVAIPTETVYGLGANAFDSDAVIKIFKTKNRPFFDPLIIHTNAISKVAQFVTHIEPKALQLAQAFWPGPLTLLLPRTNLIPDIVTSGLERVAVRIPQHPLTLELLSQLEYPLAAPSANPFGYISPTSAQHVLDQLQGEIAMILDGGECTIGLESTIVGFEDGETVVYRLGGLSVDAIEQVVGKVKVMTHSSSNPESPGMLKSHYAPRKPLLFGDVATQLSLYSKEEIGIISFCTSYEGIPSAHQCILSPEGRLEEAAQKLFAAMRELDNENISVILAEKFPEQGLGLAINDRLRRAGA